MIRIDLPEEWRANVVLLRDIGDDDIERFLTTAERELAGSLRRQQQRQEWSASRIAAKLLLLEAGAIQSPYDCEFPTRGQRPDTPVGSFHVSFSHTGGVGGAAVALQPVGLDLERVRTIDPRTYKLFLTTNEERLVRSSDIALLPLQIWSAKEALFKTGGDEKTLKKIETTLSHLTPDRIGVTASGGRTAQTRPIGDVMIAALAFRAKEGASQP
ncbi:MAG TPA: 4'-phosphopantetheinyl transferase superfamily protein [Thermoanaerobaculia bacterium]|nr:4'-phosphopantetheinyl transferase superfamily protein [Thermoanaerobaculia bacterium]